jgi:Phosphoglucose isomerase
VGCTLRCVAVRSVQFWLCERRGPALVTQFWLCPRTHLDTVAITLNKCETSHVGSDSKSRSKTKPHRSLCASVAMGSTGQPRSPKQPHPQHLRRPTSSSHHHSSNSSSTYRCINAAQAWSTLERHKRQDIDPVSLRQLLRDNDRVSSLVSVYATESDLPSSMTIDHGHSTTNQNDHGTESRSIIVDLSRQRMTSDTMNLLFRYASSMDLKRHVERVAWGGQNDPRNPVLPARLRKQKQHQQQKRQDHHQRAAAHTSTTFLEMEAAEDDDNNGNDRRRGHESSSNSGISSMHMALRVPAHRGCEMLDHHGNNVLPEMHREWDRVERTADCYRRGQLRGATGAMIQNVIVIGRGVPVATIQFVYGALVRDERAQLASRFGLAPPETATTRLRRNLAAATAAVTGNAVAAAVMSSNPGGHYPGGINPAGGAGGGGGGGTAGMSSAPANRRILRVLSSIDPIAAAEIVADLDPAATLVVSIALRGDEETGLATKAMKSWLLSALANNTSSNSSSSNSNSSHHQHNRKPPDYVLKHHMVLVTGNDHIAAVINKPESVHVIPQHARCEAFTSFTSAVLLVRTERTRNKIADPCIRAPSFLTVLFWVAAAPVYCFWLDNREGVSRWCARHGQPLRVVPHEEQPPGPAGAVRRLERGIFGIAVADRRALLTILRGVPRPRDGPRIAGLFQTDIQRRSFAVRKRQSIARGLVSRSGGGWRHGRHVRSVPVPVAARGQHGAHRFV